MSARRFFSVALFAAACATTRPVARNAAPTNADVAPSPTPPPAVAAPVKESVPPYSRPEVSELRDEAHDVLRQQSELSWKNWVSGDDVDLEASYQGHDALFSTDAIRTIRSAREAASGDAERALLDFELYLAGEVIAKDVAKLSDAVSNIQSRETLTVAGVNYAYRDLDKTLANEPTATQRAKLYAAELPVLAKVNPLLEQRQTRTNALVKKLGFTSYAAMGASLRDVNLEALSKLAEQTLTETESLYTKSMDKLALDEIAIPLAKLHRSDLPRLFRGVSNETEFPGANLVAEAATIFRGLGIDVAKQEGLSIDLAPTARKNPRAVCIPVEVPSDVRVSVKPRGGAEDYRALFHEMGHAEHYVNTKRPEWEFQQLGNNTVTEAYAFLIEGIVDNPAWLTAATKLKGDALSAFVRHAATQKLYMLRRYAAKVQFETLWHSGKLTEPPAEAYRKILSRAYGFQLTADDAQRYLVDTDDFFYSADYFRAWFLAAQLDRHLAETYGARWWEAPAAGDFLKGLWAEGNRLTADEVAQKLGAKGVDPAALLRTLNERLGK
jgi:hypothetical protein